MFTGIITDIGEIVGKQSLAAGVRFRVKTNYDTETIDIGASIAHDGLCLTVVSKSGGHYEVEAWEEALRLTTADTWNEGTHVNLERALKVGDELGGHIVAGHVDGTAIVEKMKHEGDATRYSIDAPMKLAKFIAPKGSVALNGTSLTINKVQGVGFDVLLIKHSQEVTTWGKVQEGDRLNIEIDTIARYAARLSEFA